MVGCWCLTPLSTHFSYIVAISFICGGNWSTRRKPPTCRKSLTNFITSCCIEYISSWTGFELTTLVVIGTDFSGICKSNYHTITTAMNIYIFRNGKERERLVCFSGLFRSNCNKQILFSTPMYIYCVYIVILNIHNKCQFVGIEIVFSDILCWVCS